MAERTDKFRGRVVTDDDLRLFHLQLSEYKMYQLEMFYEYFTDDLIYIIETIDTMSILRELSSRHAISVDHYLSVKKGCGVSAFAQQLVQDVLDAGKDAVLGLWESLYALQSDHPHPNLLGILDELCKTGHTLEKSIQLDQMGHTLPAELKGIQVKHKQYLREKTQNLEEYRAPGSNQEPQSFNISDRYLDLIVVSSQHFRNRTQHEIIQTGGVHEHYMQQAQSRLERITANRLLRWSHRLGCMPQAVMVSGVPGVGKTTLMQKFVYDWVNGKLYQRFAFVFFFKFRTLNKLDGKISLENMILDEYPHLQHRLGAILQDPEKLLFIFDGLDESVHQIDFKSPYFYTRPQDLASLGVIVASLVRQSLLKGCSVLMTSRPTKLASVDINVFHRVSDIMGFFPKQREMYFEFFFSNNKEMAQKAFHYVRENGILYTFCYIPSYCWIICTVLSMCFNKQSTTASQVLQLAPKTLTQLIVTYVANILSNHCQHKDCVPEYLTPIGWMAEHGVMNHVLAFEKRHLETFNVDATSKLLSSFIIESDQPPHVTYSFFHLIIQEFMAALVHYLDYSSERLHQALSDAKSFEDGRGEIFLRFISGLSDNTTRFLLKPYFGDHAIKASKDVIGWLRQTSPRDIMLGGGDKRKCLNVYACLFESRNKALVIQFLGTNRKFDFSEFHLAPVDCTVLAFILESCQETEVLDLDTCYIQTEGLERLSPNLHSIKDLRLATNNLRDEDMEFIYSLLTNPKCRIENLSLRNNGLTENCCCVLALAIHENQSLRALDLSKNKLAGQDFYNLVQVFTKPMCRIENLSLQETKLTPEYARFLVSLNKNPNLTHLNLSNNFFTDKEFGYINDLILKSPSLREIRLSSNDFSLQTEEELTKLRVNRPDLFRNCTFQNMSVSMPGVSRLCPRDTNSADDLQLFRRQLCLYEMYQLEMFYEYFRDDLIYIIETIDTMSILRELNLRHDISLDYYLSVKKECGVSTFAQQLVQDILDMGKEPMLGLWESLYALQSDHPHPTLRGILDELCKTGHTLEQSIQLDQTGHTLPAELKDIQLKHKQHLLEKTQNLEEYRAPGSNQEPQSFHISERYLDLIVVSSQHFRNYTQHEIIETGGVHEHYMQKAQSHLERISANRLFRWNHRLGCVPQAVMVSGVPGVGKTTLMHKFVYDWVNGKLYQRFAFVFFFKFRTLNKLDMTSLESMIIDEYPYLRHRLEAILEDPKKLLFIFDGLDESVHKVDFKSNYLCTKPQDLASLGVIVASLVRQSLLKGCFVLMTSRPTKLASVDINVFHRVSDIMGFFPQQREMYFKNFFANNNEMAKKAFHYVRENGILYTFCYIPSYCWIICTVLSMCFNKQSTTASQMLQLAPKTLTQLIVTFIANILSNHCQNNDCVPEYLISMGWMAEYGVMNHVLAFENIHLETFNVDTTSKLLSSFIIESDQPPHVAYSFFHLIIQEFMAALVHYLDYSSERLHQALSEAKYFEDGRGEIFLRFISGLSDNATRSLLKPYFGDHTTKASKDVIGWLTQTSPSDVMSGGGDKRKCLNVYACLFESRNKALVVQSLGKNGTFDFSEFHLAPVDCTVLAFILESCQETEVLDLDTCYIQTEGLERLSPNLHSIKDLRLPTNNLRDEDMEFIYSLLTNPKCRIENLSLRNNGLTESCCWKLASAIHENQSLRVLDLSKNKLAGQDFYNLVQVFANPKCRIENLSLQETKLTPEYAPFLVSLNKNPNLTHLNLSNNFLTDSTFIDIRDLILRSPSLREISGAQPVLSAPYCCSFSVSSCINTDDLQQFRQQLSEYEMYHLEKLYGYFWDDLIYIIETIDTISILRELSFRTPITVEYYLSVKKECGVSAFAQLLVQDVLDMGKDAVLGLWESLYALQSDHPHPNLLGMLDELIIRGHSLEQQINLDQQGHRLPAELIDIQMKHKQHLLEKTQNLVEHRAPGSKKEPKYFHISEHYLDLTVVSNQSFRKRTQHEVIETGGVHEHYMQKAQSSLERITLNRLFRWCHRLGCVPQAVMVSGVPGVGKTTLMQKFVYDWVNGKLYQRFAFVFFFKFRTLNKLDMTSLESMILDEYPHLHSGLGTILQDPNKLLFIFDGLDEYVQQIDFKSMHFYNNPSHLANLSAIVGSMVGQSLLKGCSVIITSRPTKLASVETNVFHRVTEIMGFFPQQREMYFQNFFGNNNEMAKKAFHYVRENGVLYTFCYIPSYCWIICTVLSKCFKVQMATNLQMIQLSPRTITQLFVTYITNVLSNHSQGTGHALILLKSIGRMAEYGVMKQVLTFDEQDMGTFNVDTSSQLLSSFMLESIQPPLVTYSFLHLTFQEFLAALVHYLDYSSEKLQQALGEAQSFEDGRGEIFLRFISGLSDVATKSLLKPYFGELSSQASKDVIVWLKKTITGEEKPDKDEKRKWLNVYAYLFESRNKALVAQALGTNLEIDLADIHLGPIDCTVLAFILESCKETEALYLDACFIQTEGLERLASTLHSIKDLRLYKNNLRDDDMQFIYSILTNPKCRIQNLSLRHNGLTDNCCSPLAFAISENQSLRVLDLSKNQLAGRDLSDLLMVLSNPMCRIENLSLQETKLTAEYAPSLVSLSNNPNLTHLNLNNNYFADDEFNHLKNLILRSPSLKEIRLATNDFSKQTEDNLKQLESRKPGLVIVL
ncbi:uncharacterized protein WCC33_017529 [Rhinophrynus dorsalis]